MASFRKWIREIRNLLFEPSLTTSSPPLMLLPLLLTFTPKTTQEQSRQTLQILSFTHQLLLHFTFFFPPTPHRSHTGTLFLSTSMKHFLLFIKRRFKHLSLPIIHEQREKQNISGSLMLIPLICRNRICGSLK